MEKPAKFGWLFSLNFITMVDSLKQLNKRHYEPEEYYQEDVVVSGRKTPILFPEDSETGMRIAYIATLNPTGVRQIAYRNGYYPPKSYQDRILFLNQFLKENPDKGIDELMLAHPDKEMITDMIASKIKSHYHLEDEYYGYEFDNLIGTNHPQYDDFDPISAVAGLGTAITGKIGAGKERQDALKAQKQSNYAQILMQQQAAQIAKNQQDAQVRKYWAIGGAVALVVVAVVVGIIIWKLRNK